MTPNDLYRLLREGGVDDAQTEGRVLITHALGISAARIYAERSLALDDTVLSPLLARRLAGEPLQYILGEVVFCNETYLVTPDVLIPRSDTELLVELAARHVPRGGHIADLCTGSGCVAISTLRMRPDLTADAFDLSPRALDVAMRNAEKNGVSSRIAFHECDLLQASLPARYDAILSNPPYIPSAIVPTLSREVQREPVIALDGGEDGMNFYRSFLERFPSALTGDGFFLFEIGYDQEDAIRRLARAHNFDVDVHRDLGGNVRVAHITAQRAHS